MNRDHPPRKRPGFRWEYRTGCQCKTCPWKGNCRGEDWPHWREVKVVEVFGTIWRPIETAPKDGNPILLVSKEYTDPADINGGPYHHPARCAIGRWHAEGTSWCDEYGRFPDDPEVDDDTINLHVTGVWFSGGGWFQPNEITHWMPLPTPPLPNGEL